MMDFMLDKARNYVIDGFERKSLPRTLATEIFDGITRDIEEDWTEQQFIEWTEMLKASYPQYSAEELMEAHRLVNKLTEEITQVIRSF